MTTHRPTCRACGASVPAFGDLCHDCDHTDYCDNLWLRIDRDREAAMRDPEWTR